jgi:putative protease
MTKTNKIKSIKPKILAPINDFTTLQAAIDAGCDEVYFGIKGFNMRATARNFTLQDLKKIVSICHKTGVKAFLALNIIIYDKELKETEKVVKAAKNAGVDAIICWDMSVIQLCVKYKIETHLSTQNSISNYESIKFFKKNIPTLKRVVLARECSLDDIKEIIKKIKKDKLDVEIETFIHGAMCVSVSGRCMLSHHLFGKSANRGECLQPCRRNYKVYEQNPNENKQYRISSSDSLDKDNEFLLGEDAVISPKDMCTLEFIEQLIDSGIVSFKIEGRNRTPDYVYTTVKAYREVIDYYLENGKDQKFEELKKSNLEKLKTVFNRGFSKGFYLGKPLNEWSSSRTGEATKIKIYVGKILNYYPKINVAEILIEDNAISKGDSIIIHGPTTGHYESTVTEMKDEKGFVDKTKKGLTIGLKVSQKVRKNDQVYKIVDKK